MGIEISPKIRQKLTQRHGVSQGEIEECFSNVEKGFLIDDREEHATDPCTQWFVSETDHGRRLKVMFVHYPETGSIVIKSAYEATDQVANIYNRYA